MEMEGVSFLQVTREWNECFSELQFQNNCEVGRSQGVSVLILSFNNVAKFHEINVFTKKLLTLLISRETSLK